MTRALRLLAFVVALTSLAHAQSINVGPSRAGGNPMSTSSASFPVTSSTGIASVQRYTATMSAGGTTNTTITAVDTTTCSLNLTGVEWHGGGSTTDNMMAVKIALTSSTNVQGVNAVANPFTPSDYSFEIICYPPTTISRIQRNTVSSSGTTTITSVNTARSIVHFLGAYVSPGGNFNLANWARVFLTNGTTVTGCCSGGAVAGFEVVEFNQ